MLIKGDWIGQQQSKEYTENETIYGCFADSTYQNSLMQDTFKYEIRKDSLYIENVDFEGNKTLNSFPIVKLTTDSLILLDGVKQEYTLRFSKVHAKNKLTPTAIYFASSGCYGKCPIMYLEIDSSRNIRFYGERYTSATGGFKGRISENEYNSIIDKIRNLPVDSLREFYETSMTDQETLGISIIHGNTVTRSSAYGHDQEPMELHILFGKLINLYKHISMKPDSSVNSSYFLSNPNVMSLKEVTVPSPSEIRKFTRPKIVE
ncbi:hypothetical protein FAM09_03945 [Niastella caeni]|uniref:DUF6438 domain-containing protein n=1 Tax=Niastella caeni TaxID=2569763 RepID=A0A4S8HZZ9_9BACT|nr:DUF6438 domain-containing protein [Niastella caeni]THU41270.1 hypothetical protein FAM09_03945 [Niastella caeni]